MTFNGNQPGTSGSVKLPTDARESFHAATTLRISSVSSGEIPLELLRWHIDHEGAERADLSEDGPDSRDLDISPSRGAGFHLMREVARGGNGVIWESVQKSLGRVVAVKCMRNHETPLPVTDEPAEDTLSFKQEALTTASLEHPNIVPIYDLGLDERGRPLLAMKMIRGKPWSHLLREEFEASPPVEFLARHIPILIDMAQAVAFAHSRGIVHRDLKPSQVMVGEFGEVLVTDWGLAVVFDRKALESSTQGASAARFTPSIHSAASPAGTPACMAPEQTMKSAEGVGPWTDIYLLGGCLYYLLTGTLPHDAATSHEAFRRAQLGHVESPELRAAGRPVPPVLSRLCMRCLAVNPRDRIRSVPELITALQDYLSGASKRAESRQLTDEISRCVRESERSYDLLTTLANMLTQAMLLWPENPQLQPLREQVYQEYAREALGNNDLTLARTQVLNIPSGEVRKELLSEIDQRETQRSAQHRERRHLAMILALLLLLLSAGVYRMNLMSRQNEEETLRRLMDQQQVADVQDRVQQHKQVADGLRALQQLSRSETELATRLRRELPLPEALLSNEIGGEAYQVDIRRAARLVQDHQAVRLQRQEIIQRLHPDDRLLVPREPAELLLAQPLYSFYSADSRAEMNHAESILLEVYSQNPDLPEVNYLLGIVEGRLGDYSEAAAYLERAGLVASSRDGAHSRMARLARRLQAEAASHLVVSRGD